MKSYHFLYCAFLMLHLNCHQLLVNSASFYGSSFVSIPYEDSRETTKLLFKMKTRASDSLIFLATGPKDYCLVSLDAGNIRIRINLGSGEEVIDGPIGLKLNDLMWHEIAIDRKGNELTLTIDGLHSKMHTLFDTDLQLNINNGVYIGALNNFTQIYLGDYNNFRGCLDKFIFNDLNILDETRETRAIIQDVTFDCAAEFDAYSSEPISFIGDGSYITFPYQSSSTRSGGSLTFDLKTAAITGILFYVTSTHPLKHDFLALEIVDGQLQLTANDGNGVIVLQSSVLINNGIWHRIEIDFSPTHYVLTVNEKSSEKRITSGGNGNRFYDFNSHLFVGGIDASKSQLASRQGVRSVISDDFDTSFKGCIQYIKLNGQLMGLQEVAVSKGIRNGCVWEYVCLVSNPCVDDAECVQEDYDLFRCFCDADECVKPDYLTNDERKQAPQQQKIYSDDSESVQLLTISPLTIKRGSSELITHKHIQFSAELIKHNIEENCIIYIIQNPNHGVIEVDRFASSRNMPDTAFSYSQLIRRAIRYIHDGNYDYPNDSIVLKIEFFSRTLRLPDYLENVRKVFRFPINIITNEGSLHTSSKDKSQQLRPKMSIQDNVFRLQNLKNYASSRNGNNNNNDDDDNSEYKYLNMAFTGSHLLLAIVCLFTSLGLCTLLIMVKMLTIKASKKGINFNANVVDKTLHLQDRIASSSSADPVKSLHKHTANDLIVDECGRSSIDYDRSSTIISEMSPFYSDLTSQAPTSSINLRVQNGPTTPISSFGKGPLRTLAQSKYEPEMSTGNDELFPLPPPTLYFACDNIEESKYSSPRLYSFQPMTTTTIKTSIPSDLASNCENNADNDDKIIIDSLPPPPPSPPIRSDLNNLSDSNDNRNRLNACYSPKPLKIVNSSCLTSSCNCNHHQNVDNCANNDRMNIFYNMDESIIHHNSLANSQGNNCVYVNHIKTLPSTLKRNQDNCSKYWI